MRFWIGVLVMVLAGSGAAQAAEKDAPARWWKGNLHTHTLWSDGNDFAEMVTGWYRERGYHFLGLSDHNVLSTGEKWVKRGRVERAGAGATEKYLAKYGAGWVELRGAAGPEQEIRLKTLDEFRSKFEAAGEFLLIQAEEISDTFEKRPVHVGAVNITEVIKPQSGKSMVEVIENNAKAVAAQEKKVGQPMLAHLNHPNFKWAITAEEMAEAVSEKYFEVFNGHPGVNQLGDADHIPVEKMWDVANTIRMTKLAAPPLLGLASDDSHHYHDQGMKRSNPGRGWIMVRAGELSANSIVNAIKAGDFYASTGVTLAEVRFDEQAKTLQLTVEGKDGASYRTQFVGTRKVAPQEAGVVLAVVEGLTPSYTLKGDELYVRAIVVSSQAHPNPTFENQKQQAWTQPVVARP